MNTHLHIQHFHYRNCNTWFLFYSDSKDLFIYDIAVLNYPMIALIEKWKPQRIIAVLTSCLRIKQEYLLTFSKIYPCTIISPAPTSIQYHVPHIVVAPESPYIDKTVRFFSGSSQVMNVLIAVHDNSISILSSFIAVDTRINSTFHKVIQDMQPHTLLLPSSGPLSRVIDERHNSFFSLINKKHNHI